MEGYYVSKENKEECDICPYEGGCNTIYTHIVYCKTAKYRKCTEYQIKEFLKKLTLGSQDAKSQDEKSQVEKYLPSEYIGGKCVINANEKRTLQKNERDAGG